MPPPVPDLWPKSINSGILSPAAILRIQASRLWERTDGLLEAEVVSEPFESKLGTQRLSHKFEIMARPLQDYRHQLLVVNHDAVKVYPTAVYSKYIPDQWLDDDLDLDKPCEVESQAKFVSLLGDLFKSPEVVALLESLIARSNDDTVPA